MANCQREMNNANGSKLVIPTRNRPTSLSNTLGFLARFFPTTRVVIADGSDPGHQKENERRVRNLRTTLDIDYVAYPSTLSFFERLIDILEKQTDELIIMGSDDDFPLMDTLAKAENFLREHPDFVVAMGARVILNLTSPNKMTARLGVARSIVASTPAARCAEFASFPFTTTYSVTRRVQLIERFKRVDKLFLAGFYDFTAGIHDSIVGKIYAMPEIAFFCTRNYNHSYLRPEADLIFLRRSHDVLQIVDQFIQDLMTYGKCNKKEATALSSTLIKNYIGILIGSPVKNANLGSTREEHGLVHDQIRTFNLLFQNKNATRNAYAEKMAYISSSIRDNAQSSDNSGEPRRYETFAAQTNKN
jgi:glycosyltransferase domain-containing protein